MEFANLRKASNCRDMSTEFFDAIKQGSRDEVERQLNADPGLIHIRENGLSPIMIAAYHGQREIASLLADKTVALTIFEAAATGKINNILRLLARAGDEIICVVSRSNTGVEARS